MTSLSRYILPCLFLFLSSGLSWAETGHKIGQTAPGFELMSLEGDKVSLESLTRKGHVMLVFWATECVYCYAHIKDFNNLHDKYHDKGLTVAGINVAGEYEKEVREYATGNGLKYMLLAERLNNLDVAEAYNVVGTPTLVLISPDGKVLYYGYQIDALRDLIEQRLNI